MTDREILEKLYEYCESKTNSADRNIEKIGEDMTSPIYWQNVGISSSYWDIAERIGTYLAESERKDNE